jgi:hypothetical protein
LNFRLSFIPSSFSFRAPWLYIPLSWSFMFYGRRTP